LTPRQPGSPGGAHDLVESTVRSGACSSPGTSRRQHTLAARLGARFARAEYAALLLAPFALLAALEAPAALPLATLPWAAKLVRTIHRRPPGRWLNGLLAQTALLGLAFAGLLAAGFAL